MSYSEFCSLLSGIMPDTPLGQIVSIRAEKDVKVIKAFTNEQRRIRNEWLIRRNRRRRLNPAKAMKEILKFQQEAKRMFS